MPQLDPLFQAISYYRRRKFEQCVEVTTDLLSKNSNDQVDLFFCRKRKTKTFNERIP